MRKPVLVSGTDGVGTKLKLAFLLDKHDTVGIDCVAMCVNDIDLLRRKAAALPGLHRLRQKRAREDRGRSSRAWPRAACRRAAALVGGETAEMPGFYPEDEYDLAGFSVGVVDRDANRRQLEDHAARATCCSALPSSGVHSNGFSLVRKVFGIGEAR